MQNQNPGMPVSPPRICAARTALLALLLTIAGCSQAPRQQEITTEAPVVKETPPPAGPTAEELAAQRERELACARITVAAAGDIMLGTDFPDNRLPDIDQPPLLAEMTPYISGADIAFGNLEGVLMDGGEPSKTCKDPSACYLFRSPTQYAQQLADAGFTVMSLANNHARDFGEEGRSTSMDALAAAGIKHSGRAGDIATWPDGKIRVALIAFAPFTESNQMLDLDDARAKVARLDASFDLVIVSFHGGAEGADAAHVPFARETYYGEDRGDVVEFSRAMVAAGADLLIGHGPHVPRAFELHEGRLIAYSLGNFATYYGISVSGDKGLAPLLIATVNGHGEFISGEVVSAVQQRPFGPRIDTRQRAYERIWELTEQDFAGGGLDFQIGGNFFPADAVDDRCQQLIDNELPAQ